MTTHKEQTVDSYYFSPGLGLTTKETIVGYEDRNHKYWSLVHRLSTISGATLTELPLQTVDQIDTYITMLQKIRQKMIDHHGEKGRSPYSDFGEAVPDVIDGYNCEEVYTDKKEWPGGYARDLLGYNLIDEDGQIKGFLPNKVEGRGDYADSCSDDSSGKDDNDSDTGNMHAEYSSDDSDDDETDSDMSDTHETK